MNGHQSDRRWVENGHQSNRRTDSWAGNGHQSNRRDEPLHERLSIARRNSRRNIHGSNQHYRERERETGRGIDEKEQEINILRDRIETMERERRQATEPVDPHHQKNVNEAQSMKGPGENDLSGMKAYLTEVLKTISAFDKRLTTQMGSNQTHLDK